VVSSPWSEAVLVGGPHDGMEMAISKVPHRLWMPDLPPNPLTASHGEVAEYWDSFPSGILTYHRCGVDGARRWRYVFGDHGPICAPWLVKP
jgi:hypothetical protein